MQMQTTFQMLRFNDLSWSYRLHSQLRYAGRPVVDSLEAAPGICVHER